jgi:hypothetical protein
VELSVRFWDSSALLQLLVRGPESERLESLLKRDSEMVLWWGAPVDCEEALAEASRRGGLREADRRTAQWALERLRGCSFEIQPQEEVRARALRLLALHRLNGAQAFELAAALVWCREKTRGMSFVSLSGGLRGAAAREGFRILPYSNEVNEGGPEREWLPEEEGEYEG